MIDKCDLIFKNKAKPSAQQRKQLPEWRGRRQSGGNICPLCYASDRGLIASIYINQQQRQKTQRVMKTNGPIKNELWIWSNSSQKQK